MSFWNDPANNSAKTIIALAVVVLVGFGIYELAGNNTSLTGNVFRGTQKVEAGIGFTMLYNEDGSCILNACIDAAGNGNVMCVPYQGTAVTGDDGSQRCRLDSTPGSKELLLSQSLEAATKTSSASASIKK